MLMRKIGSIVEQFRGIEVNPADEESDLRAFVGYCPLCGKRSMTILHDLSINLTQFECMGEDCSDLDLFIAVSRVLKGGSTKNDLNRSSESRTSPSR